MRVIKAESLSESARVVSPSSRTGHCDPSTHDYLRCLWRTWGTCCSLYSSEGNCCADKSRAPVVSNERLPAGREFIDAAEVLAEHLKIDRYDALIGPEIGGANGMACLAAGATMDTPVVDADCLGRAFPKINLALPYVYDMCEPWPSSMCDGSNNHQVIVKAENFARFENIARGLATETGSASGIALCPLSASIVRDYCVNRSLSACWSIGRAVNLARLNRRDVGQAIVSSLSPSRPSGDSHEGRLNRSRGHSQSVLVKLSSIYERSEKVGLWVRWLSNLPTKTENLWGPRCGP